MGLRQEAWKEAWWYRAVHQRIGICCRRRRLAKTNRWGLSTARILSAAWAKCLWLRQETRLWGSRSDDELPDPAQLRNVSTTLA